MGSYDPAAEGIEAAQRDVYNASEEDPRKAYLPQILEDAEEKARQLFEINRRHSREEAHCDSPSRAFLRANDAWREAEKEVDAIREEMGIQGGRS